MLQREREAIFLEGDRIRREALEMFQEFSDSYSKAYWSNPDNRFEKDGVVYANPLPAGKALEAATGFFYSAAMTSLLDQAYNHPYGSEIVTALVEKVETLENTLSGQSTGLAGEVIAKRIAETQRKAIEIVRIHMGVKAPAQRSSN